MANWFVTIEGKERGPLTDGQLRQLVRAGNLQRFDLVRREDSDRKLEAGRVKGLFESQPEELPTGVPVTTSIRLPLPRKSVAPARMSSGHWGLIAGLTFLGLFMLLVWGNGTRPEPSRHENDATTTASSGPVPAASQSLIVKSDASSPADRVRAELRAAARKYLPDWEQFLADYERLDADVVCLSAEFRHAESLNSTLAYLTSTNLQPLRLDLPSPWSFGCEPITVDILLGNEETFRDALRLRSANAEKLQLISATIETASDTYSDSQRTELAHLEEQGPPEKDWKSADWSEPRWKSMDKRKLQIEKERAEAYEQQRLRILQEKRRQYEDRIAVVKADIERNQEKVRASVDQHFRPLSESVTKTPTMDVSQRFDRCMVGLSQLRKHLAEWRQLLTAHEPESPTDHLVHAGGITHLIEGNDHFISHAGDRPKVIVIPPEFRGFYYDGAAGPNEVVVNGMFRFAGNVQGRNGFGATVSVEKYVCDPGYVANERRRRAYQRETQSLTRSLLDASESSDGINVIAVDRLLRMIVKDDQ